MLISIFFLLLIFGGGGAMLALIVFAIMNKRFWLIPAAGGFVFFGLIAIGLLASLFWSYAQRGVTVQLSPPAQVVGRVNAATHTVVQGPPNFNGFMGVSETAPNYITHGVKWSGVVLCTLLIGCLVAIVFRRVISPCAGHGFRRAWPVIPVGLFIGAMLLFRVRSEYTVANQASIAEAAAAQQAALEMAARQQILIANQGAHIASQVSQQLAQADIHEQMDKFDAPHIPLPPAYTSPKIPAAPVSTNAPQPPTPPTPKDKAEADDSKSTVKAKHDDSAKSAAGSDRKRKKSDKAPTDGEAKQPPSVAESTPPEKTTAKKENAPSNGNSSSTAESKPENAGSRPAWIDEKPKRIGNVRREVIATEEFALADECYQAADVYLLLKTYQYVQQLADRPYPEFELPSISFRNGQIFADGNMISTGGPNSKWIDGRLRSLTDMGIGIDFARSQLVTKDSKGDAREYIETLDHPMGQMKKLYLQIEFTPAVEGVIRQRLVAAQRQQRFAMAGAGAGSILSLLALAFALLKIDTWTKGYYTKRLFIGVPAAIIAGFLLLAMLGTHQYR